MSDPELFAAVRVGPSRRWLGIGCSGLGLVLVAAIAVGYGRELRSGVRALLRPDPVAFPVAPSATGIDVRALHAQLLPRWVIALSRRNDSNDALAEEHAAAEAIRTAIAPDPGLAAIFEDLDAMAQDPAAHATELLDRVDEWNRRLAALGEPWMLDGAVQLGDPPTFYVKSYQVLFVGSALAGDQPLRLRVVDRVDDLNVVERYLGIASTDRGGAVVVVDRVTDFVLDDLWPNLDPSADGPLAAFRGPVRAEIAAGLPADDLARLERSAGDRARLRHVVDGIHARHACGSRFVIPHVPWNGLTDADLDVLRQYAAGSAYEVCPSIVPYEVDAIATATENLRSAEIGGLLPALERLVAFTTRVIGVHEARHVLDDARYGRAADVPCPGCGPDFPIEARAEASAYATAFANPDHGAVALMQACSVASDRGANGAAIDALVGALLPDGCAGGSPDDLAARAASLEHAWFDRDDRIGLPADWPDRLPVE